MKKKKFKPVWSIHNSTYRRYAKGLTRKQLSRYGGKLLDKIKRMLRKEV